MEQPNGALVAAGMEPPNDAVPDDMAWALAPNDNDRAHNDTAWALGRALEPDDSEPVLEPNDRDRAPRPDDNAQLHGPNDIATDDIDRDDEEQGERAPAVTVTLRREIVPWRVAQKQNVKGSRRWRDALDEYLGSPEEIVLHRDLYVSPIAFVIAFSDWLRQRRGPPGPYAAMGQRRLMRQLERSGLKFVADAERLCLTPGPDFFQPVHAPWILGCALRRQLTHHPNRP